MYDYLGWQHHHHKKSPTEYFLSCGNQCCTSLSHSQFWWAVIESILTSSITLCFFSAPRHSRFLALLRSLAATYHQSSCFTSWELQIRSKDHLRSASSWTPFFTIRPMMEVYIYKNYPSTYLSSVSSLRLSISSMGSWTKIIANLTSYFFPSLFFTCIIYLMQKLNYLAFQWFCVSLFKGVMNWEIKFSLSFWHPRGHPIIRFAYKF